MREGRRVPEGRRDRLRAGDVAANLVAERIDIRGLGAIDLHRFQVGLAQHRIGVMRRDAILVSTSATTVV